MIFRRIADFAAKRNWGALAIELLIVVIGVFLGLQAQEWNEKRIDREKEKAYVARLSSDFTAIDEDLERCLLVYRNSLEALDTVADTLESRDVATGNREDFADALVRMTASAIPPGRSVTFVEMLSTGELGLLRDPALRDALFAYDEQSQISRETWRVISDEVSAYGRPLHENVRLGVDLDAMPMSSIAAYDLDALANDPRFGAMLNVLAGAKANLYERCRWQRRHVEQVRNELLNQRNAED